VAVITVMAAGLGTEQACLRLARKRVEDGLPLDYLGKLHRSTMVTETIYGKQLRL
jgi:hypothetical protein